MQTEFFDLKKKILYPTRSEFNLEVTDVFQWADKKET